MIRGTPHADNGRGPETRVLLQETAISLLLGIGLGLILNDLFIGLIVGAIYGLANYLAMK